MAEYLTYKQAGALVHRSPRTIRYWKSQGMETSLVEIDGQMVRVVEKKTLQAWFRERLMNWPVHKWRLRRMLQEQIEIADRMEAAPNQVVEHLPGPDPESN